MIKTIRILCLSFVLILFSCKEEKVILGTLEKLNSPVKGDSKQPFLFSDGTSILMSWTQKVNDSLNTLNYSTLSKGKWTKSKEIAKGDNWFVNWADFPAIAKNKDRILIHFLQKSDTATFAYDVRVKQSGDNGTTWKDDFKLHQDSTLTEHGFATILPYKENSFFITWLDGRNTKGGSHDDNHKMTGAMNIRTATILSNGEIVDDTLVDHKTCDCCQTSAAITSKGPIIVYRDRTDNEIRDIYISRLIDDKWTKPKAVHNDNWEINGCPVNGPKADAIGNTLVVAWFTAANDKPKVNLSFSSNNGETFNTPIRIDNGKPIGRVDVALIDDNNAIVSWMETKENNTELKMIKVNIDGSTSNPFVVSTISESRGSGFPQFELINNKIIVAWNHIDDKHSTIKTASFSIDIFN